MISLGLVKGTDSVNPTADAYKAKTQELDANREKQRQQEQADSDRKDAEMLRVFELAGDGLVNEAQHYANTKGVQVPDEVYSNADLAKGLSLAGKIYPGDPAAAQKFTQGWMTTQGDMQTRLAAAQQSAGVPVNPEDRMLQRQIALEEWKLKNAGAETMTPYQAASLDLQGRRLDYEMSQQDVQKQKDSYITADGVVYQIQPDGSLAPRTQPQSDEIDVAEQGFKAYNSALSGVDPDKAEENALGVVSFAQKMRQQIQKANPQQPSGISTGLLSTAQGQPAPASSLEINPMDASNAAIARQQGNIGTNPYQTTERQNLVTPNIPPGLPPGTIYEGTSNGYPVYRDPEGNRYIDDGAP